MMDAIIERCAGLDVHQATVVACVLIGEAGRKPHKEIRTFPLCQVEADASTAAHLRPLTEAPAPYHSGKRRQRRATAVHSYRIFLTSDNRGESELTVLAESTKNRGRF